MGQQHRKVIKRRRRLAYLQRKKELARNGAPLKPTRANSSDQAASKPVAKKAPAKKASAKKAKADPA